MGFVTSQSGPGGRLALGVADAAEVGIAGSYNGVPTDPTTVLIRYTLVGDANLSGGVDIADFSILASSFNQPGRWRTGDSNYNGTVDLGDFALLAANFNQSVPAALPRVVPEPGAAVALAAVTALRRRRNPPPTRR
jgi:hypothetical protein